MGQVENRSVRKAEKQSEIEDSEAKEAQQEVEIGKEGEIAGPAGWPATQGTSESKEAEVRLEWERIAV